MTRWFLVVCCLLLAMTRIFAAERTLSVGPGKALERPSQAAAVARDGDIIEIAAGAYPGDVAVWRANGLTIRGIGGRAVLDAAGKAAQQKAIWVIAGHDTTVENIEFTGCKVPDKNGAGIRQEGANLTVRGCVFRDNEDGILAGANPASTIILEASEFAHNGFGDGYSHNIYIGHIRRFVMQYCYSHHAYIGHQVKSRAEENLLYCNRIGDEADGRSSYLIQLPNGGRTLILGNLLHQGPRAENSTALSFADEGATNPLQELYVVNNTFVNERGNGRFLRVSGAPATVRVVNNLIVGTDIVLIGNGVMDHNLLTGAAGFVDAAHYNYQLVKTSPAAHAGVDPGKAGATPLLPGFEYVHPLGKRPRSVEKLPTIGAYALQPE